MYTKGSVNTSTNIALIWNLLVEADSYWVTSRWAKSLGYSIGMFLPPMSKLSWGEWSPMAWDFISLLRINYNWKCFISGIFYSIFLGHYWPLVTQAMGEKTWAWGTCDITKFSHVCQCGKGPWVRPPSLSLCTHLDTWDQDPLFQMAHEHQMKLAQM